MPRERRHSSGGGSAQPTPSITTATPSASPARPGRHRGACDGGAAAGQVPRPRPHRRSGKLVVQLVWRIKPPRQAAAERRRDRQRNTRLLPHQIEEGAAFETQHFASALGLDAGGTRAVGEQRHLAERLAGAQHLQARLAGTALVGRVDTHRTGGDQIESVTRLGLTEDDRARLVGQRLQVRCQLGERHLFQAGEQIDLAEQPRTAEVVGRCRFSRRRVPRPSPAWCQTCSTSLRRSSCLRSWGSSCFLRSRMDAGVTSTSSSSSIQASAGPRSAGAAASDGPTPPWTRADVGQLLALERIDLEVVPAAVLADDHASYTFPPGSITIWPRSSRFHSAYATASPAFIRNQDAVAAAGDLARPGRRRGTARFITAEPRVSVSSSP